jgi:hypothetical protein
VQRLAEWEVPLGSHPPAGQAGAEGEGEMTDDNPVDVYEVIRDEPGLLPWQDMDAPFLVTTSELRERQTIRRRKRHLSTRSEATRRLLELVLKARPKG